MRTLWQDLRYAIRVLGKNPGFTAVAVLTLALGIGCALAMFSTYEGAFLNRPPARDLDRLANVWVTNYGSGTVSKIRASDGTILGTFPAGLDPLGIAFDGTDIWIAERGTFAVGKLRTSDGATLGTFPTAAAPYLIAFDGSDIWVTGAIAVQELRPSDGAVLYNLVETNTAGIAFDGANIWVANTFSNVVNKM